MSKKKWHAELPKQRWEQAATQPHCSEPSMASPGRSCSMQEQQGTQRPVSWLANWPKRQTGPDTKHTDTEVTGGTTQSQRRTGCLQERTQYTVTLRTRGRPDHQLPEAKDASGGSSHLTLRSARCPGRTAAWRGEAVCSALRHQGQALTPQLEGQCCATARGE